MDLVALAPTSFAALYGFLVRGGSTPDVQSTWELLTELERQGRVRLRKITPTGELIEWDRGERAEAKRAYSRWLTPLGPTVSVDAVAVDNVGCWITSTTDTGVPKSPQTPG